MKKIYCLLVALLAFGIICKNTYSEESHVMQEFKGWKDILSSDKLDEPYSPDCLNVYTDEQGDIVKRRGSVLYNDTALPDGQRIRKIYKYTTTTNKDYIIVNSSWSVYASPLNGLFTAITTFTFNSLYTDDYTTAKGYLYRDNGYNNSGKWDGATYTEITAEISTGMVSGKYIEYWHNRLWKAGVAAYPNRLFYSNTNDLENFASANYKPINENDGDYITAIKVINGDRLIVTKNYSTYEIIETAAGIFITRMINPFIGCLYKDTISEYIGFPIWVSHRGVELFTGSNFSLISTTIDNYMKSLRQLNPTQKQITITSGDDFNNGTFVNCSSSAVSGNVVFNGGITTVNISSENTYGNWVSIKVDSKGNPNIVFTNGDNILFSSCTENYVWHISTVAVPASSYYDIFYPKLSILNDIPIITYSYYVAPSYYGVYISSYIAGVWTNNDISDGSKYRGQAALSGILHTIKNSGNVVYSTYNLANNFDFDASVIESNTSNLKQAITIDNIGRKHIVYQYNSGDNYAIKYTTFTSNLSTGFTTHTIIEFNTGGGTYLWGVESGISIISDSNNNPHMVYSIANDVYYSSFTISTYTIKLDDHGVSGANTDCDISISSDNIVYIAYGYLRRIGEVSSSVWTYSLKLASSTGISFSTTTIETMRTTYGIGEGTHTNALCSISVDSDNIHIAYYNPVSEKLKYYKKSIVTPTYTSEILNSSNEWKQWGVFNVNDDGTISYYAKTSTSSYASNFSDWGILEDDYEINNSTGQYMQIKAEFDNDSSSTLYDYLVNYYDTNNVPMIGVAYNQRYYLSVMDGTSTVNNSMLVLQKNNEWSKFDNINVGAANVIKNYLYTGDARNTGYVYRQDVNNIYTDNGRSYNSYWTTKVFDFNNPVTEKTYNTMWAIAKNTGNEISIKYRLDGSTGTWTSKTLNLYNDYGIKTEKIPFEHSTKGRYIQYKIDDNHVTSEWEFKRLITLFDFNTLR